MRELSLYNCRIDGRFDVREILGRGSYAEVFLSRDILSTPNSPHSNVVIKALNVFLQNDLDPDLERTLIENFQNEAVALDRVRHPNIISRLGHGTAKDLKGLVFHYLVLEYLSGGDLQSLLRKGKVRIDVAIGYVEQICAGLGHAHRYGVIHRDIKPQNLLLTADKATVKIADFGVARVSSADSPITLVGTNIYAPPEHSPLSAFDGKVRNSERLTPAADIYSLAKSMYTIVTGEAPRAFANETITKLPDTVARELWADGLLEILKKATQYEPTDRYSTVEEFWVEVSSLSEFVTSDEYITNISSFAEIPQPHVSRGYTPNAPVRPAFDSMNEEITNLKAIRATKSSPLAEIASTPTIAASAAQPIHPQLEIKPKKKRKTFRRLVAFAVFAFLFTGLLYGTATYMRGVNLSFLPDIPSVFGGKTGTANTDVYLRPSPNTDNDPIGLVTRNSKLRIVNSQNNWYQVDIVEQGRNRPANASASRGWVNGKYLDLSSN